MQENNERIGGKGMVKKRGKRLITVVMCACMMGQMCTGVFADELDNSIVNMENGEVKTGEENLKIQLKSSLEEYFENDSNVGAIRELEITSTDGYKMTAVDLQYLIVHFSNLNKLDVTNCQFDSKETYDAFQNYFKEHKEITFLCTEIVDEEVQHSDELNSDNKGTVEDKINSPEIEENVNDETIATQEQSQFDIKLNGICLLDKGSYAEVGVAYESNDQDVEFRWLQYDLSKKVWTVVSDWNKGNWITWKPKKSGDYWIYVEAKTTDGKTATSVYGHHYGGVQVDLNGICMLDRGTRYDVGVAYKSNDPELKFRWKVYDLQKKTWTLIQKETTGNWTSWYPEDKGDYWLLVEAIDSNGEVHTSITSAYYEGIKLELNGICTITNKDHIDMGVAYKTNDVNVQFQWKLYDLSEKKWSSISDWSSGNWTSWYPDKPGDYWLYVEAKTRTNKVVIQVLGFRV